MQERYRLIEPLGVGGMATVHRAKDEVLGRQVAIKRLLPHLAADPGAAERFRREAQAAAGLNHPGIVTVYDTGADEQGPYIVMELIEGETLAAKIGREGALEAPETAAIVRGAAEALDHAHANGVVHRDIKPSNLIVDGDGKVRLTDFGIARAMEDPTTMVTSTGELVGTLAYMAPETLSGEPATPASDIYSLGAVAYQMLAGRPPFQAENAGAFIAAIREEMPPPLGPNVPSEIGAGVFQALAKDPSQRPESAGSLGTSLVAATTMPLEAAAPTQPLPAAATTPSGPAEPTRVYTVESTSRRRSRGGFTIPLLLLVALGLVLAVLALAPDAPEAAPAAASETTTSTTLPATTTTTTPTTTTTMPATTTLAPDSPEAISAGIYQLLEEMRPPEFQPNEIKEIRERLDEILVKAEERDSEKLRENLEKAFERVGKLPESDERERLFDEFSRLAESYGFTVRELEEERGEGKGDD